MHLPFFSYFFFTGQRGNHLDQHKYVLDHKALLSPITMPFSQLGLWYEKLPGVRSNAPGVSSVDTAAPRRCSTRLMWDCSLGSQFQDCNFNYFFPLGITLLSCNILNSLDWLGRYNPHLDKEVPVTLLAPVGGLCASLTAFKATIPAKCECEEFICTVYLGSQSIRFWVFGFFAEVQWNSM